MFPYWHRWTVTHVLLSHLLALHVFFVANKLVWLDFFSLFLPVESFLSGDSGPQDDRTPEYLSPAGPLGQKNSQLTGIHPVK